MTRSSKAVSDMFCPETSPEGAFDLARDSTGIPPLCPSGYRDGVQSESGYTAGTFTPVLVFVGTAGLGMSLLSRAFVAEQKRVD